MGTLENTTSKLKVTLGPRFVAGRSPRCDLVLGCSSVSGEHASIQFSKDQWMLRDLGSKNGTRVDGERVSAGTDVPLAIGSQLRFGAGEERWVLSSSEPPRNLARRLSDGTIREATNGLLLLPDDQSPEGCVLMDEEGRWTIEIDGDSRPARDHETIKLSDGSWLLELFSRSEHLDTTRGIDRQPMLLRFITLHLQKSMNGEYIELGVEFAGRNLFKGDRSHNEMLTVLARARLEDKRQRPDISVAEHGWLYVDDLCRDAGVIREQLNLQVHRARRLLTDLGVENAGQLIERRPSTREIRLGTDNVIMKNL